MGNFMGQNWFFWLVNIEYHEAVSLLKQSYSYIWLLYDILYSMLVLNDLNSRLELAYMDCTAYNYILYYSGYSPPPCPSPSTPWRCSPSSWPPWTQQKTSVLIIHLLPLQLQLIFLLISQLLPLLIIQLLPLLFIQLLPLLQLLLIQQQQQPRQHHQEAGDPEEGCRGGRAGWSNPGWIKTRLKNNEWLFSHWNIYSK